MRIYQSEVLDFKIMKVSLWSIILVVATTIMAIWSVNRYIETKSAAEQLIHYDLAHYKNNIKQEIRNIEEQYFNNWVLRNTKFTNYYIEDISFSKSRVAEAVVVYYNLYDKLRFRATYTVSAPNEDNQYIPTCFASAIVVNLSTGKNIQRNDWYDNVKFSFEKD